MADEFKEFDESGAVLGPGSHPHNAGVEAARTRVAVRSALERSNASDAAISTGVFANMGFEQADLHSGRRLLQKHIASMPMEERVHLANEKLPGTDILALNDPGKVLAIVREALGPLPEDPAQIDAEIAATRKRMRDDAKGYFADDRAQLRYRELVRRRGEHRE